MRSRVLGLLALTVAATAADAKPDRTAAVLPPPRPAALATLDVTTTGSIVQPVAAEGIELAQAGGGAGGGDRALLERANAALNAVTTLTADFAQTGGDGRPLTGTLYMQRPGKLRFEYNKPSTMEVVSDGSTVLVRDRKLNTSDPYPISQTPLKFLTASRIDLGRQTAVSSVTADPDGVRITLQDSTTLGGTSRITLTFDREVTELRRWRVVDPQGYTTTVTLSDIEKNRTIDPRTFQLNYSRPVE